MWTRQVDPRLRQRRVKLPHGGQAHRGSGTILGGLIRPQQQQQVAFWEDQDDERFLKRPTMWVKTTSLTWSATTDLKLPELTALRSVFTECSGPISSLMLRTP